jgi:hypothetical protein
MLKGNGEILQRKITEDMAQVVGYKPSNQENLHSIPSTAERKGERKGGREGGKEEGRVG